MAACGDKVAGKAGGKEESRRAGLGPHGPRRARPFGANRNGFCRGSMVRDARQSRAPHQEAEDEPHPEKRALARVSKDVKSWRADPGFRA
jgi:hypothetical protein